MNEQATRYMQRMEDVVQHSDHKRYPAEGALTAWQEYVMTTYGLTVEGDVTQEHLQEWTDLQNIDYAFAWPEVNWRGDGFTGRYEISIMAAPMYAVRARIENSKDYIEVSS